MALQESVPEQVAKVLENIYYDVSHPASYGGVLKLAKASNVPIKNVKNWLASQDAYTLHKPVRIHFKRRKVLAFGIGELMQCDLVDMSKLAKYNRGVRYILTAIDVFSKKGYAVPLKRKNASSVLEGFKKLLKEAKLSISKLHTDRDKEFFNNKFSTFLKKKNIHHYSNHSEFKASVVERFNRTLKNKLYRIFTHRNSYKYLDVLKSVLKSYNESTHRSTGFPPSQVRSEVEPLVFNRLYEYTDTDEYKFNIGDRVRISKARNLFSRGFLPNWSDEVFEVLVRYPTIPRTYVLIDLKKSPLKGKFYEYELQKILKQNLDFWRVEKVLKKREVPS